MEEKVGKRNEMGGEKGSKRTEKRMRREAKGREELEAKGTRKKKTE